MNAMRISSDRITELAPNEIFVFGSNRDGLHYSGAARLAYQNFEAVWGVGTGLQGQTYAIPTMQRGISTIKPYVDEFLLFAWNHQNLTFLVTEIGLWNCWLSAF